MILGWANILSNVARATAAAAITYPTHLLVRNLANIMLVFMKIRSFQPNTTFDW
jgi:hypothetical protein